MEGMTGSSPGKKTGRIGLRRWMALPVGFPSKGDPPPPCSSCGRRRATCVTPGWWELHGVQVGGAQLRGVSRVAKGHTRDPQTPGRRAMG